MGGVEEVVFHRVARPEELNVLESRYGPQCFYLDIFGQAGAEAVDVHFNGVPSFGFDKKLVSVLVAESFDFVFDAWAVTRAKSLDSAIEHGRSIKTFPEEIVHIQVGIGNVAASLFFELRGVRVRESLRIFIPQLLFEDSVVDASSVYAGRGTGFHAVCAEAVINQLLCDAADGFFASSATAELFFSDVHQPIEKGSCRDHYGLRPNGGAKLCFNPNTGAIFNEQFCDGVLPKIKPVRLLQHQAPLFGKSHAVVLCPGRPHSGSL